MPSFDPGRRCCRTAVVVAALVAASGCAATFQDARMLGTRQFEITPGLSGVGFADGGESEYVATALGAQARVGLSDRLDVGLAYARYEPREGEGGVNLMTFGPKIGVVPDRFAVALPVSFAFGEDVEVSETWQLNPMAVVTVPVSRRVDLSPSFRLLVPLCSECDLEDTLVGVGLGVGVRARPNITLRPEFGVLVNPGEDGVVWTVGFAVSVNPRR